MNWSKKQEEKRLCTEWLKDPLVNPETGRAIEKDGPKYKEFQSRCIKQGISPKPVATGVMTWRKCQEWRKNPGINPETGRKLALDGPTWRSIEKKCQKIEKEERSLDMAGEYPRPDSKGLVPVYNDKGIWYTVRRYKDRNIYGPHNLYCRSATSKIYFKDTWDYRYGHYKPIFLGMKEPARDPSCSSYSSQFSPQKSSKRENPKYMVDSFLGLFM